MRHSGWRGNANVLAVFKWLATVGHTVPDHQGQFLPQQPARQRPAHATKADDTDGG